MALSGIMQSQNAWRIMSSGGGGDVAVFGMTRAGGCQRPQQGCHYISRAR